MRSSLKSRFLVFATALLALMAGCGGGGGGGGDVAQGGGGGNAPDVPTPQPVTSGLVPTAPVLGAVLQADAATLRPFIEGATWRYRAALTRGTTTTRYETVTTHTAATAQSVTERDSNPDNDGVPETTQLQLAGGEVFSHINLDFTGKGAPGRLRVVELRSPVRSGDQVVLVDSRYTDTDLDVDRDGRTDALDVAVYTRVVGIEPVVLPNLGTVQAVRVDLVVSARVRPSSQTTPGPVIESRQSNYYLAGVGPVRSVSTAPASDGSTETTDVLLTSWDGISTGLGAMPAVAAVIPAGNAISPGQTVHADAFGIAAIPFENHALLLTAGPGSGTDAWVHKINRQGQVVSTRLAPLPRMNGYPQPLVYPVGFVYFGQTADPDPHLFKIVHLDSDGNLVGPSQGVVINLTGNHAVNASASARAALSSDGTLWVLASRSYRDRLSGGLSDLAEEKVLMRYSLTGERLGSEQVLPALADGLDAQLAATPDALLVSMRAGTDGRDLVVARITAQGAVSVRTVASQLPGINTFVQPFQLPGRDALLWLAELGTGNNLGASGGVLLAADLSPVRSGGSWLDEQLPWMPQPVPSSLGQFSLGSRLVSVGQSDARLWADDSADSLVTTVGWTDVVDDTALARKPARSVRVAGDGRLLAHALFDDRVLLFSDSASIVKVQVVWLPRAGAAGS